MNSHWGGDKVLQRDRGWGIEVGAFWLGGLGMLRRSFGGSCLGCLLCSFVVTGVWYGNAMRLKFAFVCVCVVVATGVGSAQLAPKQHTRGGSLPVGSRAIFEQAMQLFDASYDAKAHLVRRPQDGEHASLSSGYMVRESSWYALALLARDRAGDKPADAARAVELLNAVLDNQYLDPKAKWYGTFKRTPEEPLPPTGAIDFRQFDPNWRVFVGTTFQMILIEYPQRIPAALKERMYRSIDTAISGEMQEGRLTPHYTNIALMYGSLWDFAAVHDHNADWAKQSAAWAREVHRLYELKGTFDEFNAPTYYGVDLYGLALWREYASSEEMREMGRSMERGLWNSIADFYQPEMRNIAGPYDRSYGMDMTKYVEVTGVWMRSFMSAETAPLPEHSTLTTDHVTDIWFAPQVAVLGAEVPAEAMAKMKKFVGPHLIDVAIDDRRTVTTWVAKNATWGGEFTSRTKDAGHATQFHPAVIQWKMPNGEIGWVKITRSEKLDAVADVHGIAVATDGDVTLRIFAGNSGAALTKDAWPLPGLGVNVVTDAAGFTTKKPDDCEGCVEVTYTGVHVLRLNISAN
jgi:hypothetical protein